MTVAATSLAVAGHGLLGSRRGFPAKPLSDEAFDALLARLTLHRVVGLAASAASVGQLKVTDLQADRLHAAHVEAMCICLHLEATLLDVQGALASSGVSCRVVKGPASAHLDYADPTLRAFGDIDLLVRSDEFDTVSAALPGLGFHRSSPEPRPGFDRRFGKGATYLAAADGTNLDLHRTFVLGPLGLQVRLDELWDGEESFVLAGQRVSALAPPQRLLGACYNAIVGDRNPRLSTLRDIAQLVLGGEVVAADVVEMALGWQAGHVLALGIRAAWDTLDIADVVALSVWAKNQSIPEAEIRSLAVYHDEQAGYAGLSWATARLLPPRERLAFLRALAFPAGGRLGSGGWGLAQRVRRAARGYGSAST
jgi:hypothetical protein